MDNRGNIVIFQTKDGKTSIDVKLENETVWLTQAQMSDLFQKDRTVIGRHINNVYREGELERDITCAKFAHMGIDKDQQYETTVYNLDVIISVGYRVKSQRGTQFRIWANGGEELYPSIEEKATMLFYLVVKNHSFSDGNKRIADFLFLWFLDRNDILYKPDGSKLIGNNTLVALTLMIAESRTEEKDMMVKVVINLINRKGYYLIPPPLSHNTPA